MKQEESLHRQLHLHSDTSPELLKEPVFTDGKAHDAE